MASDLETSGPLKYLRIGTTALIVGLGVLFGSASRARTAMLMFLPFAAMWSISPVWSASPLWGLFYKGMFTLTFLSGVMLSLSPRTLTDMEKGLRLLGLVSAAAAIVALFEYVMNPAASMTHDRMSLAGMNANLLAQTASPLAILCAYLGLYSTRKMYKKFGAAGFSLLLMLLLLTSSRGGLMMALIGCGILMIPLANRPGMLVFAAALVFGCGYVALELLNASDDVRVFDEMTKDTRSGVWGWAIRVFKKSPLIGCGWLIHGSRSSWATVQSAYLQVLAETGVVGALLFASGIVGVVRRLFAVRRNVRSSVRTSRLWYLASACIAASLFHGLAESSLVLGTSLTPMLLGFGVGLVDRIPALARSDAGGTAGRVRYEWMWVPAPANGATSGLQPAVPGLPAPAINR